MVLPATFTKLSLVALPELTVNGVNWFANMDDAAYAFGEDYNVVSLSMGEEIGAVILAQDLYKFEGSWYLTNDILELSYKGVIPP